MLCSRCAPHMRCRSHPHLKLTSVKLESTSSEPDVAHWQARPEPHLFRGAFLSLAVIEETLRSTPAFLAPRGAQGPVLDCTSAVRCDCLQVAKTSTFPECIAVTFTQNIPKDKGARIDFTVVGTIWPGDTSVELWPKQSIASSMCLEAHPWTISKLCTTPIFPEDRDGDVFGLAAVIVRAALQSPCVWSRMPWLNKPAYPSYPTTNLPVKKIRRQQLRIWNKEVCVNGSVLYSSLRDDQLDFLCPVCGQLQSKGHFFSSGCGIGASGVHF